ncbi:MAG: HAD family phosphatase [Kiritimatiellaeota bacterium]|nr:HAD family phosphatase [Kiritimatiellota bacterium]
MTPAAFIFDLDGTLIDSEMLWVDAMIAYLADRRCVCARDAMMTVVFGRSWVDIHREITARFPALAHVSRQQMADKLRGYYERQCEDTESILIHSSVTLLKTLARDYPVIVVSGSPHDDVEAAVRLMGAQESVRFVLGAEDYSPGKPSPAGFLLGARLLGVMPSQCVVFEDSWAGVTAAKAAGMVCVALTRPTENPQDLSAADLLLADLADFSLAGLGDA